ncbi:MAG: WD40 repeat domain-containing protein [Treponema sp.]|jgi:hypothetical protein|nr:WD40 repeat domain-containing protein [Treponema sp.]
MAKKRKRVWIPIVVVLSLLYIFFAAQSVRLENVLKFQWITSIEAESRDIGNIQGILSPFMLSDRFGYIDEYGNLSFNKAQEGYVSLSDFRWAEYDGTPSEIDVQSPLNETLFSLSNLEAYPFFLDNKNFVLGKNQNSISNIDENGNVNWKYDFDAPITCIDAKANLLFAGLLNGTVVLLDRSGNEVFSFEALGSRISIIYACKISDDGSKLAVVSGLDEQRFLLFEQFADSYRVVYHEYIGEGFRRPVMLSFIDEGRRAAFEREGGIGMYDIADRKSVMIPLDGSVYAMDNKGQDGLFFVITSLPNNKKNLVSIRYPGTIMGKAPFKTDSAFLSRNDSSLIIGGGNTLISFELEKR